MVRHYLRIIAINIYTDINVMVKTICIDNKDKPFEVPLTHWINEGTKYTIKHVYNMIPPDGGKPHMGVTLMEINIESLNLIYQGYKIERFGFAKEDLEALLELIKACTELNDFDPMKLIEEQVELIDI
tara:strand:+ start:171 stop:554 length:384 start_codon:yes stop_codon:yes gene_type:complete